MSDDDPTAAPLPLRWLEEFVNTRSVEFQTDEVASPAELSAWLEARDLVAAPDLEVSADGHRRALRVREGLRALIAANNGGSEEDLVDPTAPADGVDPSALADLVQVAPDLPLILDVAGRPPGLVPREQDPVDAALASMLAAVALSVADGSWNRLKVCREPGCRWAYYDHSRNRSRAWCDMATCGNRAKARAFRSRTH